VQTCRRCHTSDHPNTAKFCSKCGGPLKPSRRKEFPDLSPSDLPHLHTGGMAGALTATPLLLLTVAILMLLSPSLLFPRDASGSSRVVLPPPAQLCRLKGVDLGKVQPGKRVLSAITFSNCGEQPLVWQELGVDFSWLKLNKSSGTLAPNRTEHISFTAIVPLSELGLLSVPVTIIPAVGQSQQATVTMTVVSLPPSPAQLCEVKDVDLGQVEIGRSISGTIPIGDCGGQPLQWSIQQKDGWGGVSINNSNGTVVPNGGGQISVTARVGSEHAGKYRTSISITSNGGTQAVTVSVEIVQTAPPPAQLCHVQGVDLGQVRLGQSVTGTVTFGNCGGQPLTWQGQGDGSSWLQLSKPSNGTIAPNGTDQIPFTATASTSAQGLVSATVTIIPAVGQPQQAVVSMTVVPLRPRLVVTSSTIDVFQELQKRPSQQTWCFLTDLDGLECTLSLSNTGDAADSWKTTQGTTTPPSGVLPVGATNQPITVFLGVYYCTSSSSIITVQGQANSVSVQITDCPVLQPHRIAATAGACTYHYLPPQGPLQLGGYYWACTVLLTNLVKATWFDTGTTTSWHTTSGTTKPPSGILTAGATNQPIEADIYNGCSTSITIQGEANSVTVQVGNCGPPPVAK